MLALQTTKIVHIQNIVRTIGFCKSTKKMDAAERPPIVSTRFCFDEIVSGWSGPLSFPNDYITKYENKK
jgi:hypothetical protein